MIRDLRFGLVLARQLVTLAARSRNVSAGQVKLRLLVLRQGEGRWPVSLQIVALVAAVFVRLTRELVVVLIFVAVRTALEFDDLEDRGLTLRDMTAAALHLRVPVDQGIVRFAMALHIE